MNTTKLIVGARFWTEWPCFGVYLSKKSMPFWRKMPRGIVVISTPPLLTFNSLSKNIASSADRPMVTDRIFILFLCFRFRNRNRKMRSKSRVFFCWRLFFLCVFLFFFFSPPSFMEILFFFRFYFAGLMVFDVRTIVSLKWIWYEK